MTTRLARTAVSLVSLLLIESMLVQATTTVSHAAEPGPTPPPAGPAILNAPPADSPALENTGIWRAEPILISGASSYRDGEFVYQDFLYDDHGDGIAAYPPGAAYAGNAADLVEVRVRPLTRATAFRLTYNTLIDPTVVGTTIALGDSVTAHEWPLGGGVRSPAQVFVTVHGDQAAVHDATGRPIDVSPAVSVDLARRQVEVRVPRSVFDPTGSTAVRVAAGTGVWDTATGSYLRAGDGAALFNMAFRFTETVHPRGIPISTWWRDSRQREALASGDVSEFVARIDFTKLAARVDDDMPDRPSGVPTTGSMTRIHVTRLSDGQGRGTTSDQASSCDPPTCSVQFRGDLQPYFVHVPSKPPGPGGYGLTAYLHGCGNNQHELFGSRAARELAGLGPASLVIAGGARGDCLWYQGPAMANLFEAWADVATRYPVDAGLTTLTGYSMGGYGALRTASLYPDLFARVIGFHPCTSTGVSGTGDDPVVGSMPSLRHVSVALWNSVDDPLCTYPTTREIREALDATGAATSLHSLVNDHFTDMTNDVLTPAIAWLTGRRVVQDPARVTYVVHPRHVRSAYGLDPDHAYWLSGLRVRDTTATGTVDARTEGLGHDDGTPAPLVAGSGVLTDGELFPALPYTYETRFPGTAAATTRADRLHLRVRNLSVVRIDPQRAGLSCGADVHVDSDGPVTVHLLGCDREVRA